MSENTIIQLEFTVEEVNLILNALGQLPYVKAVGIIEKISQQAGAQWKGPSDTAEQSK